MKFKVGDKVRIADGWEELNGYTGVVVMAMEDAWMPYNVTMDDLPEGVAQSCPRENWLMAEDELELVNED
jgi:hypothetical protein